MKDNKTPFGLIENEEVELSSDFEEVNPKDLGEKELDKVEKPIDESTEEGKIEKDEVDFSKPSDKKVETEDEVKENRGPDPEEVSVEVSGNLVKYQAEDLKAKGALPEDFEITDDLTEADVNKAYLAYKEEPLRGQIREEILEEFRNEGITTETIEQKRFNYAGVTNEELGNYQLTKVMSTYKFDDNDENYQKNVEDFLTAYYTDFTKVPQHRLTDLIQQDLNDPNLEGIIEEYQTALGNESIKLEKSFRDRYQSKKREDETNRKKRLESDLKTIDTRKIKGLDISEEESTFLKKALTEKNEIVKVGDKMYRTTLYNKRRMEAKNDPELALLHKAYVVLASDLNEIKRVERSKNTGKVVNKLNDYLTVNVTSKNNKGGEVDKDSPIERTEIK